MGMFDEVLMDCPHCGHENSEQTKAGKCTLATYTLSSAPSVIKAAMDEDSPFHCQKCGGVYSVIVQAVASVVRSIVEEDDDWG